MNAPRAILGVLAIAFIWAMSVDRRFSAPDDAGEVHIDYWEKWTGVEGEATRATVELFNSKKIKNRKGQTIVCHYLPTTSVDRKSLMAIAGGSPPDVAGLWTANTYVFAEMGAIQPLDEYAARDGVAFDDYIEIYRSQCQFRTIGDDRERTWCIPTTPATTALHWNKDMFRAAGLDPERPPESLRELEEFADKLTIKDASGKILQIGFLPIEPGWWNWAWGYFFGGQVNRGSDRITVDDPANVKGFEWTAKFADKYGRASTLAFRQGFGTFDSPQNAFISGKVAMVMQGVWFANNIRFHNPSLKYGCAPFPSAFDDHGQPVTIADMDTLAMPTGCRHPEEAWEFIKFIHSREGAEYLCGGQENNGGQGKFSPLKDCSPGFVQHHTHPYLQVFIDLAKSANTVPTPRLLVFEEMRSRLFSAFEKAWLGLMTPEQALKEVQASMQPKLERALRIQRARRESNKSRGDLRSQVSQEFLDSDFCFGGPEGPPVAGGEHGGD